MTPTDAGPEPTSAPGDGDDAAASEPTPGRVVHEAAVEEPPALSNPEWAERFPWLVQGTTHRGARGEPFDLGLYSDASAPKAVLEHWRILMEALGLPRAVVAHQVHGAAVRWAPSGPPGLQVCDPCDGHATDEPGCLLAVTAADCVPVFVVDPQRRAIAVLHAGWRGTAAGILEAGLCALRDRVGSRPADVHVHLGPAICGACYEVGPEVFEALGLTPPGAPAPVDLRAVLAGRARAAGVPSDAVTTSQACTRCGDGLLFSHRGGDRGRHVGYIGVRP